VRLYWKSSGIGFWKKGGEGEFLIMFCNNGIRDVFGSFEKGSSGRNESKTTKVRKRWVV